MPVLAPVVGVAEVQHVFQMASRTCTVRTFYSDGHNLQYTDADILALATAAEHGWRFGPLQHQSASLVANSAIATDLTSPSAFREEVINPTNGAIGVESEPLNVALVYKIEITRRYRGGKNHIYVPGIPQTFRTPDEYWSPTTIANFQGDYNAYQSDITAVTTSHGSHWKQVTVSRFTGHAERVSPLVDDVANVIVQSRVCTRRRRLPKLTVS